MHDSLQNDTQSIDDSPPLLRSLHRPRRSAQARRDQQRRSDARMICRLLSGLCSINEHRGNQLSEIGHSLMKSIQSRSNDQRSQRPICRHFLNNRCSYGVSCRFAHIRDTSTSHNVDTQYSWFANEDDKRRDDLLEQQLYESRNSEHVKVQSENTAVVEPVMLEPEDIETEHLEPTLNIETETLEPEIAETETIGGEVRSVGGSEHDHDGINLEHEHSLNSMQNVDPSAEVRCVGGSDIDHAGVNLEHDQRFGSMQTADAPIELSPPAETPKPVRPDAGRSACAFLRRSRSALINRQVDRGSFGMVMSPAVAGKRLRGKQFWKPTTGQQIAQELAAIRDLQSDITRRLSCKSSASDWKPNAPTDTSNISFDSLKTLAKYLLAERDPASVTIKQLRTELENYFDLDPGQFISRTEHIKSIAVSIVTESQQQAVMKRPASAQQS